MPLPIPAHQRGVGPFDQGDERFDLHGEVVQGMA
jgi:hypothetical protein